MNLRAVRSACSPERPAFAVLVLFLLTLLYSYPAIFHLSNCLIGGTTDSWQFPWNSFIFREQISHFSDPYFTDYIFYPVGTSLLLHSYTEFNGLVSVLLSPFCGIIAAHNIAVMLSTFLSGIGTYLLARRVTNHSVASLFAAIAFAFSPFRMISILGHVNFALTQWIPFSIWALLKMGDEPRARNSFLTALMVALTCYSNYYYGIFLAIAFCIILLYGAWRFSHWRSPKLLAHVVLAGLVTLILLAPIELRLYRDYREGTVYSYEFDAEESKQASAHIRQFFQIGPTNTLLQDALGENAVIWPYSKVTAGWTVLSLGILGAVSGIRRKEQKAILLAVLGLLFYILALGPYLRWWNVVIPMPYSLLARIPYVNHVRIPLRFAFMGVLSLALLASYQVSLIAGKWSGTGKRIVLLALFALLLFELASYPVGIEPFDPPKIFYSLGPAKDETMITVPFSFDASASPYLCDQIAHRKRLLNGRLSRPPWAQLGYFSWLPITRALHLFTVGSGAAKFADQDREVAPFFRWFFHVTYVTLYPPYSSAEGILDYVHQVFPDAQLLSEEDGVKVWKLPGLNTQQFEFDETSGEMSFFLYAGWRLKATEASVRIFADEDEAELLLPAAAKDQVLRLKVRVRSTDPDFVKSGKAKFCVGDTVLKEARLGPTFGIVEIDIPGSKLMEARRILKIKLESPSVENPALLPEYQIGTTGKSAQVPMKVVSREEGTDISVEKEDVPASEPGFNVVTIDASGKSILSSVFFAPGKISALLEYIRSQPSGTIVTIAARDAVDEKNRGDVQQVLSMLGGETRPVTGEGFAFIGVKGAGTGTGQLRDDCDICSTTVGIRKSDTAELELRSIKGRLMR